MNVWYSSDNEISSQVEWNNSSSAVGNAQSGRSVLLVANLMADLEFRNPNFFTRVS